jgi:NADH-quinone oxidoreductase subunit J
MLYFLSLSSYSNLFLILVLSFNILASGFFLITGKNPVYAVLLLISVFINVCGLLLMIEVEFLCLISLIIYVGAIAVLFLFVVMMLDIKLSKYERPSFDFFSLISFLSLSVLGGLFFINLPEIWYIGNLNFTWDYLSNPQALGLLLYTNYLLYLLVTGILLLVAMLGAIVLSLPKISEQRTYSQSISEQLSRHFTLAIFEVDSKN